jgi:hypothetical protein
MSSVLIATWRNRRLRSRGFVAIAAALSSSESRAPAWRLYILHCFVDRRAALQSEAERS